ncbi:MAG: hypothetical protein KC643_32875 [Nitrospira sp.]|nr:hypothetical protein [Nitrospira sp.]
MKSNHPKSPWRFVKAKRCLAINKPSIAKGEEQYHVDVDRCRTSAGVLDAIMQVAGKTWATDQVLASLVRDLQHYLKPQQTLCSGGKEQGPIDVKTVLQTHGMKE